MTTAIKVYNPFSLYEKALKTIEKSGRGGCIPSPRSRR